MNTMKNSLLVFPFIFLCFLPNPLLGAPEPLLDVFHQEVVTGTQYYIVSAHFQGGGLNLLSGRNEPCPMDVFQERSNLGRPVSFLPLNYNEEVGSTVVYDSTDMNIQFNIQNLNCEEETTVWKVDNLDDEKNAWFITTNGVAGNPRAVRNWFKFEKVPEDARIYTRLFTVHRFASLVL
ncbi:hypothetical protein JRO89_XS13G0233600 [Xanthoceras sorbifolium]|uniref:Miraculin-like n=1 Tax=Xanthoceras sorbifolium TaxID=99658 RepID=A0ABQ8H9N8_9ROSI|nr:hypothetical protein JRO89_XS13G0233600 [Xanthoceras sorbifolium]